MFSVFIYNNVTWLAPDGYSAYMTPFVWMFIKTYEKLRSYLVQNKKISSLIQMEYSAFEEALCQLIPL
jgi:Eco57I restriction endonuclease.